MYTDTTYTVNDVLKHVKRQFGDEAAIQISDEDIIRWVNIGQIEIFRRIEPIKSSIQTDIVANQGVYTFPTNILKVQSILVNGIPVPQLSTQEAEEYVLQSDPARTVTGQPTIWYEWGGTFTFYPTPDTDVVNGITLQYVKKPDAVVDETNVLSIPDVYYSRLIEFVLQQAYELDENFTASEMKGAQFTQNLEAYGDRDSVSSNTYPTITILEEDL